MDAAVISVYPYDKGSVTENISNLRQRKEEIDYYALWLIAVAHIGYFKGNQLHKQASDPGNGFCKQY